jgi:3-oxoacyl-[acyl-carrier protein] reductase
MKSQQPEYPLSDKVTLVTGASKGIGRSIALLFAQNGADVVLAARTKSSLEQVADGIKATGRKSLVVPTDISSEKQVDSLVRQSLEAFGRIDILVNNAGLGIFSRVGESKIEDFDTMVAVNLRGLYLCTRAVLSSMIERKSGVIVNISSLAGKNAIDGGAGYCATKWAVIGFSRSLMLEVREHRIRVVTLCPGSVNTSFSDHSKNAEKILQPDDVAEVALAAIIMPERAMVSEIDIRPTNPK